MSRVIKKLLSHKKKYIALCVFIVLLVSFWILGFYIPAVLLAVAAVINELTFRKMNRQKVLFGTYGSIRNIDCLVIGDVSPTAATNIVNTDSFVCINSPNCTLVGIYELLRHTFSILKENGGKVILVVKEKNIAKKGYSIFEIAFFHDVTIHRLGLENKRKMSRFPFLFSPVKSLIFLAGRLPVRYNEEHNDAEIEEFCSERGVELSILKM